MRGLFWYCIHIVNVTWVRKMCGLFWYCIMSESSLESTCGPRAMSGLSTIPVMIACSVLILGIYLTWLDAWTDAFIKSLSSSTAYCQSYDIHELYDVQDLSIISEGVSPFIKPSRGPAEITFIMHVGWYISSFVWRRDYNTWIPYRKSFQLFQCHHHIWITITKKIFLYNYFL